MTNEDLRTQQAEILHKVNVVRERFPDVDFPNPAREPVWYGRKGRTQYPGKTAIVDSTTDEENPREFAIVSDIYGLRFHEEVAYSVLEVCDELPEFGAPDVRITLPSDGGKMRMKVRFPEVDYEIRNGDVVNPQINVLNSYDLGWKLRGIFGAFRLICSNGMIIGEKWAEFAKRHMDTLMISELVESVKGGMIQFSEQTDTWKKWAETQINHDGYAQIWENLGFSDKEKEKIEELPEQGTQLLLPQALNDETLTLWDFNSVVTQYVTHEIESELRRVDVEPRVASVFANHYRMAA